MSCEKPILDDHTVYRKCHQTHWDFETGTPEKQAFKFDEGDGAVSAYWAQFPGGVTPEAVLEFHADGDLDAVKSQNGVLALGAGKIRAGSFMDVRHTPHAPSCRHPSHSSILPVAGGRFSRFERARAYKVLIAISTIAIQIPSLT